jgi:hypothetical protein
MNDARAQLADHIAKTYTRNAEGDGHPCRDCNAEGTVVLLDSPTPMYVCEACYNLDDDLGLQNCYHMSRGMVTGGLPGAPVTAVALPVCCWNDMERNVVLTWHGGRDSTAHLGRLHFPIRTINGVDIWLPAARRTLFQTIANVLAWVPLWHDSEWSLCVCCDAAHARCGQMFTYHRRTGAVVIQTQ